MIEIINWQSFQSYKDRKPPWVRLHRSMLDNFEFHSMSADARALLPMLWLLASEDIDPLSGCIRYSIDKIAFRLRLDTKTVINSLREIAASGFILLKQSCTESVHKELRNYHESVTPETETETETETEKTLSVSQAKSDPVPYGLIIESANQILGKKFRATEKHKSFIRARWNEGFREDDFATVCSTMLVVWGSDPKMQAYLRPETLFGNKMDGYLNTVPVENRELSKSEQWRKEAKAEVDAFVYGGRNDQDNGQHTGQTAICKLHDVALQSPWAEIRQGSDSSLL